MGEPRESVGSDDVRLKGDSIVLSARCEMPDWKATRYRKTAVVFRDRTYYVASRAPLPGGRWRYVLEPWPEDLHDAPGNTVLYDEGYVLERDALREEQARLERKALGLFFVTWLLGFLFSGAKLALNERYGIHPVTVTRQSLFLEYLALISLGALLVISALTGILPVMPFLPGLALIAVDYVVRSDRVERESMRQYGFGEWIFRRLGRDEDS